MCGRYRRKSDKQRIADAFEVTAGLDQIDLAPEDDIAPGSVQPVVAINQDGRAPDRTHAMRIQTAEEAQANAAQPKAKKFA